MNRLWLLLLMLSGCGATPYTTVGLGYQIDGETDYWLQRERTWQCSKQPSAHIEIGLEFENKLTVAAHHQSWLLCGAPFNNDPEVDQNEIRISKTWGGK